MAPGPGTVRKGHAKEPRVLVWQLAGDLLISRAQENVAKPWSPSENLRSHGLSLHRVVQINVVDLLSSEHGPNDDEHRGRAPSLSLCSQ
jgi:hypothetical protein